MMLDGWEMWDVEDETGSHFSGQHWVCSVSLGKLCQWTDACLSHPCANGSTCTTVANQFSCRCLAGFTGQKCETDVNECDIPGQCQHGGTCLNLLGSYQCQCPQGFTGQHCDSPYVPCAPSPCVNGGTCRQTGDFTFECNCLPGKESLQCPGIGGYTSSTEGGWWVWLSCCFRKYPSQQGKGEIRILCGVGCWWGKSFMGQCGP